jgi:adenine-specific DNA-methyltransferase
MATGITPSGRKRGQANLAYTLSYPGKMPKQEVLALKPHPGEAIGLGNPQIRLLRGDNLGILLSLLEDKTVFGHIRCVYIDPPYATSMAFVDRNVQHAYTDTLGGAAYLEFLRRRLIVLRELLAEDGSIFVHLDQNMAFEAKIIMDEIFGRSNFRNIITRAKCNPKNYTRRQFGNISDHILFYTKNYNSVWHRPYVRWKPERIGEEYPCVDPASGRRYKKVPLHAPGVRNGETGMAWRGKMPPPGKHWQYRPSKLDQLDKAGEIYWSPTGNPRRKVFFDSAKGIPVQDIWLGFRDAHNQNILVTGYPTEKNLGLLRRIIRATTNPGDWVLDCFCGSGTTLEAAKQLGRNCIGIDNSEAAIAATVKRFASGRERMGDFVKMKKSPSARPPEITLFG